MFSAVLRHACILRVWTRDCFRCNILSSLTCVCPVWSAPSQRMRNRLKAQRASCSSAASSIRKSNISPLDSDWWVGRPIQAVPAVLTIPLNLYLFLMTRRGYRRTSQSCPHPYKEMPSISNRYVFSSGIFWRNALLFKRLCCNEMNSRLCFCI